MRSPLNPGRVLPLTAVVLLAVGLAVAPLTLVAQESELDLGQEGRIVGTVVDATTGEPMVAALVRIRGVGRTDMSHADGGFHLERVQAGTHTLVVERLGYATYEGEVEVRPDEVTQVRVALRPSAIALGGIVVTGVGRERGVHETYQPTSVLSGAELERKLSWSLTATIAHEPGISMQSFGPSPAQPVIRGLGGDRVLVLEDGQRTGDMSTTGPDHAVGIDPISARRIEVVRGPAGLLYGSNALGGVINVIREEVPRSLPEGTEGLLSVAGASVNRGMTVGARGAQAVADRFALRGEVTARVGGDVRTPDGVLSNTDSRGYNASVGGSWLPAWGFMGVSYRDYLLDHGVPGEFDGESIPGAHPGGADLETRRRAGRFEAGHFSGLGPFSTVELDANAVHYTHEEIEGIREDGSRIVGTSFDQITATAEVAAHHEHPDTEIRDEGALGAFVLYRDLITGGSFPGTRDSKELNLAAFAFEELVLTPFRVQVGARFDWHRIEPVDTRPIDTGESLRPVGDRTFADFSGSVAGLWELADEWTLGVGLARAFRSPSVRELFSAGPHLADFSYDIGNPELGTEVGLGTDLFVRWNREGVSAEATVFRNAIRNFIHYRPTGEIDRRFFRFPIFEATAEDALFVGADGRIQWELRPQLVLDGTLSYVRAEYRDRGEPLPAIPALNGRLQARYDTERFWVGLEWEGATAQRRVPDPVPDPAGGPDLVPETPTPGYGLVGLGAGIRWFQGEWRHSISLRGDNVLDRSWRDHLSRAKEVAPEPGRNVQLLYRINF